MTERVSMWRLAGRNRRLGVAMTCERLAQTLDLTDADRINLLEAARLLRLEGEDLDAA